MKLKLPATNLTYVILCVKYMLDGEELACNMHMVNDNKMDEVEIDTPDEAIVTTVTMNEVTNAHVVVSSQVLYDASKNELKPTNSNLKVETHVEAEITKRKEHGQTSRTSGRQTSKSRKGESGKSKEEKS